MANYYLPKDQCLRVNQYLQSSRGLFFAIMQSDGKFCVYKGSGPDQNDGIVWASSETGKQGEYFAIMQDDGNFCVYKGTPEAPGKVWWASGKMSPSRDFFAVIQDDGIFCVYQSGSSASNPQGVLWSTNTTPYNKKIANIKVAPDSQVPAAFANVSDSATKESFDVGDLYVYKDASHAQGVARFGDFTLVTHNLAGGDFGHIFVIDNKQHKVAYHFPTPDYSYNHPGGCQQIGSFLAVGIENGSNSKSMVRFYNLAAMTASDEYQPELLDFQITRSDRGTGGVGITNFTEASGKECYLIAAMNDLTVDFYKSNNRPISDPGIHFDWLFKKTLSFENCSEVCLLTDTDQVIYLLGFRMVEEGDADYVDLYKVDVANQSMTLLESRHVDTHSPGNRDGMHFRWAGGVQIYADNSLRFLATERIMMDTFDVAIFA